MTLTLLIGILSGLLVGAVAALKVIAPLTKNTVDDRALEVAEKIEDVIAPQPK